MTDDEIKEYLKNYLKENLRIVATDDSYEPGYGYGGTRTVGFKLLLGEEVISEDVVSFEI